jgi:hypothetical protein
MPKKKSIQLQTDEVQIQTPQEPQRRSDDTLRSLFFNYLPLLLGLIGTIIGVYRFVDNPNSRITRLEDRQNAFEERINTLQDNQTSQLINIQAEQKTQRELLLQTQKDIVKLQTLIKLRNGSIN